MPADQIAIESNRVGRDGGSADFSDVYKNIVTQQQQEQVKNRLTGISDEKALLQAPSDIRNNAAPEQSSNSFLDGAERVLGAIGKGAWGELRDHYGRVAGAGALGFGIGFATKFLSRPVATAVGILSLTAGAYELATHAPKWYQDAKIVANPLQYSPLQARRAELSLQNLGAGSVDVTAGVLGGIGGSKFANSQLYSSMRETVLKRSAIPAETPVIAEKARLAEPFRMPDVKLDSDSFSIKATIPGNDKAWFRAEIPSQGTVNVTDIYKGALPKGTGGDFLAEALQKHGALPTDRLVFKGIINQPTLDTFKAGGDPSASVLGRTGARALELLGIKPENYAFKIVNGKLDLIIQTK
jgi:hypothetical protein